MEAISEILAVPSPYRGSEKSFAFVQEQLRTMFGDKVAKAYKPELCRSYRQWREVSHPPTH